MYNYVIFDVDGTLINTAKAVFEAYQKVIFAEHGRYFTDEELSKGFGIPTEKSLKIYGCKDVEQSRNLYFKYLIEGFRKCTPYDGVMELLSVLAKKKIPMGVVTSRCRFEVDNDETLKKIIHYFNIVLGSDDTLKHKPDGEPLVKIMNLLDANPEECIYIGDTIYDSQCAKNAGISFALAKWGSLDPDKIEADYVLSAPKELLDIL